jgi:hypothetical protein
MVQTQGPSSVEKFFGQDGFKLVKELQQISGFVGTAMQAAQLLYAFTQIGQPSGPSQFDILLDQIERKLDEVADHIITELKKFISEELQQQSKRQAIRQAVVEALSARKAIASWAKYSAAEARTHVTQYDDAKNACDRALVSLSQPDVAEAAFEMYVVAATIHLNVLATGMNVFPEEFKQWQDAVTEYARYVEQRLPRISDKYVKAFKTSVHSVTAHRTVELIDGDRVPGVSQLMYRYQGKLVGKYDDHAEANAARERGIALTAPHFTNPANRYGDIVRSWRAEQRGWRWCRKCQAMFYGDFTGSVCPTGGTHSGSGSGNYGIFFAPTPYGGTPGRGGDATFRWCSKCQGLHSLPPPPPPRPPTPPGERPPPPRIRVPDCPAGGFHLANSYAYVLMHDGEATLGGSFQSGWRTCRRCHALYFSGHGAGVCRRDQGHEPAGAGFMVKFANVYWPLR